jgi:NAD(P)-dependent dehydrogenase (short-subunit alcohol dehydrogenase family)
MAATNWTVQQIPSQAGKTALVTGANSGIGYQAAWSWRGMGRKCFWHAGMRPRDRLRWSV